MSRVTPHRPGRMLRAALAVAIALGAHGAWACGAPINVYPIRPNTGLFTFPGFTEQLITANLGNSWQLAWHGGGGVTHFNGRLRDGGGGAVFLGAASAAITVTQPNPNELDYSATWDSSVELGSHTLQFVTASTTAIFELYNDANFSITTYPKPDLTEGHPVGNPFALTLDATGGTIADPNDLFCNGFEAP